MIGSTISHYRILEKLGGGGMGVVYKAEDTRLKRTVALKFLLSELTSDPEAKERLVHEAQASSNLQHNNICNIHDIDQTADGQLYIVMDCYDGETVKNKIARGPLKIEDAINIALQIAEGLAKAHERGIVHRDIKPANMMITREGVVKIMDFGLAKLAGQSKLTRTGSTPGTAAYMSPEQIRGDEIDHRADLFSFGTTLYEMVTGRLPFRGDHEAALSYSIVNEDPIPVSTWQVQVPLRLVKLINRCLEKDREKRYQRADEIISELQTVQLETSQTRPVERKRGKLPLFVGAGAVAIALVVLGYLFLLPKPTVITQKSVAVLPFVDMSPQKDQEYFCDGMTEELINRLSNVQNLRVPARTSVFYFKGKAESIQEVGNILKVQSVLEGSVRKSGDRLRVTAQLINVADGFHLWSEKYDRELKDVFAIQDEISSAIVNALKLKLTPREIERISEHPIDNVKAYDSFLKAERQILRYDEKSLDSAFAYLQTGIDIMGDNAQLYAGMAYACWQYANMGIGQEEYLVRMEEYAQKALALKPDLSSALAMKGMLCFYEDYPQNLHDAFRYFRKALAANPFELRAVTGMAVSYCMIGRPADALAIIETMGHHDPLNPWWHSLRGYCYLLDCQFARALKQMSIYYRDDSTSPMAQANYSWALACNAKRDEALAVIGRAGRGSAHNVQTVFYLLLKHALLKDRTSALRAMSPEFQKTCRRDAEWSYLVAGRLSLAGAEMEALEWLENAISRGFINYPLFQCDPFLDNLRNKEQFKKLTERAKYEWEHFTVTE